MRALTTETLLTTRDRAEWHATLPATASVFGSVEYARIAEDHSGYPARLFIVEHCGSLIAYPFFLRYIGDMPYASPGSSSDADTLSPEYTGPLLRGAPSQAAYIAFRDRWEAFCRSEGIIAEFAHLHPWDCQHDSLEPTDIQPDRDIVYLDLTWSVERLWNESFTHACRKNINRSQREGIEIVCAQSEEDIAEFYRIYAQTMDRNEASDKYYFSIDYFMRFFQTMPHHARFVLATHHGRVVAGTLYLHDDNNIYSYLGGADRAFQNMRPTNAVVYHTILWGQSRGKRRLIFGGGYKPNDGIFNFKASFSPLRASFRVYKRVHQDDVYQDLCAQWSLYHHAKPGPYFPAYRETRPYLDRILPLE